MNLLLSRMIMQRKTGTTFSLGNKDSLLAAIAGFGLIQLLSRHGGIGLSPDSIVYLSAAQNIHDHGLINDYTNQPMMDFPAFYPIFLSGLIFLTGKSVVALKLPLNSVDCSIKRKTENRTPSYPNTEHRTPNTKHRTPFPKYPQSLPQSSHPRFVPL